MPFSTITIKACCSSHTCSIVEPFTPRARFILAVSEDVLTIDTSYIELDMALQLIFEDGNTKCKAKHSGVTKEPCSVRYCRNEARDSTRGAGRVDVLDAHMPMCGACGSIFGTFSFEFSQGGWRLYTNGASVVQWLCKVGCKECGLLMYPGTGCILMFDDAVHVG